MGKASLNLLAIGIALIIAAGGCTVGPGPYTASTNRQDGRIGSASKSDSLDEGLSVATDQGAVSSDPSRSAPLKHLVHYGDGDSGAVRQASGVFEAPEAVKSISSAIKDRVQKVSEMLAPKRPAKPADDSISLAAKARPSAELYVAMARLSEKSGKVDDAERHYRQALMLNPRDLDALVGYARLKDRQGRLDEATQLYQQAATAHPREPSILNDLGLCFARRGMFSQSIAALLGAIRLQPNKELYRNNIAMVLVETGNIDAALSHLKAVQSEAVAFYRVGYILQKRGDSEAAATLFAKALEKDRSLTAAKLWLDELGRRRAAGGPPVPQVAKDPRLGHGPMTSTGQPAMRQQAVSPGGHPGAPLPPGGARPQAETTRVRQLPPVNQRSSSTGPQFTEVPGQAPGSKPAPLPPLTSSSRPIPGGQPSPSGIPVVQPLPPVGGDTTAPSP